MSKYKNCRHCLHKEDAGHNISGTPYYCGKDMSVTDGEDGLCSGYEADEKAIEFSKNYKSRDQLIEELALTKQKLETSERHNKDLRDNAMRNEKASFDQVACLVNQRDDLLQAIRESQEQEPISPDELDGYVTLHGYMPKLYTKQNLEYAVKAMAGLRVLNTNLIHEKEAAQLHIKELREQLEETKTLLAAAMHEHRFPFEYEEEINDINEVLAKQPDTRALDKALLEAEIAALTHAYDSCKPYGIEFSYMITDRIEQLAELNKE